MMVPDYTLIAEIMLFAEGQDMGRWRRSEDMLVQEDSGWFLECVCVCVPPLQLLHSRPQAGRGHDIGGPKRDMVACLSLRV